MEITDLNWRKASYSNGGANACIEVADADMILVRDTKDNGTGPVLGFTPAVWQVFTGTLKDR